MRTKRRANRIPYPVVLHCKDCKCMVPNTSKYRGRFVRRHTHHDTNLPKHVD